MTTELLFREDPYLKTASARVLAVHERGIELGISLGDQSAGRVSDVESRFFRAGLRGRRGLLFRFHRSRAFGVRQIEVAKRNVGAASKDANPDYLTDPEQFIHKSPDP